MKARLTWAAFGWAAAVAVFLLFWPTYTGGGTRVDIHNGVTYRTPMPARHATMIQMNGLWVIAPVCFPAAAALLPLLFRREAVWVVSATLVPLFSIASIMSIGFLYVPAAFAIVLAACLPPYSSSELRLVKHGEMGVR